MSDTKPLTERLEIKAMMIQMGERIAYGSDSGIMHEAVAALKKLIAERDQLQSKLGDAIQSSAHWQHQFTEAQAENERLDKENTDSLVSLATAIQHRDGFRKQLDYHRHEMDDLEEDYSNLQAERDALQSKLDAMGNGEPVGFVAPHELKDLSEGFPATVVMFRSNKRTVPLYAAPKALEPTWTDGCTEENCKRCKTHPNHRGSMQHAGIGSYPPAAHGIGGTP